MLRKMLFLFLITLVGCASNPPADRVTLGTVQQHIHKGISGTEVQEALGSPNIISKNSEGQEVWTYDKVSKTRASRSFLFWSSGETTQRTLTILITFDENSRVLDFTYHQTEF